MGSFSFGARPQTLSACSLKYVMSPSASQVYAPAGNASSKLWNCVSPLTSGSPYTLGRYPITLFTGSNRCATAPRSAVDGLGSNDAVEAPLLAVRGISDRLDLVEEGLGIGVEDALALIAA